MGKINSPVLYACALDFVEELRQQKRGHQLVLGTLALRMLVEALRCWPRANLEYGEIDTTPRLPRRDFIRVYEFMTWCRKDAFRLEQLCRFLGSSEERFTRLFRAATNTSPANFYNRMLLERGRDLLVDPSMSVKEISYTLGFRTTSHFVASFHREFGAPPAKYRANGGDNDSLC
jgi:transcriptional regulator GlxA family with amidase domain